MEFKHTPAPWINVGGWVDAEGNGIICSLSAVSMKPEDIDEANANLIAAAPELLDTLQELIQTHEYSLRIGHERIIELGGECDSPEIMINKDSSLNKAKSAIAKALGQQ